MQRRSTKRKWFLMLQNEASPRLKLQARRQRNSLMMQRRGTIIWLGNKPSLRTMRRWKRPEFNWKSELTATVSKQNSSGNLQKSSCQPRRIGKQSENSTNKLLWPRPHGRWKFEFMARLQTFTWPAMEKWL